MTTTTTTRKSTTTTRTEFASALDAVLAETFNQMHLAAESAESAPAAARCPYGLDAYAGGSAAGPAADPEAAAASLAGLMVEPRQPARAAVAPAKPARKPRQPRKAAEPAPATVVEPAPVVESAPAFDLAALYGGPIVAGYAAESLGSLSFAAPVVVTPAKPKPARKAEPASNAALAPAPVVAPAAPVESSPAESDRAGLAPTAKQRRYVAWLRRHMVSAKLSIRGVSARGLNRGQVSELIDRCKAQLAAVGQLTDNGNGNSGRPKSRRRCDICGLPIGQKRRGECEYFTDSGV